MFPLSRMSWYTPSVKLPSSPPTQGHGTPCSCVSPFIVCHCGSVNMQVPVNPTQGPTYRLLSNLRTFESKGKVQNETSKSHAFATSGAKARLTLSSYRYTSLSRKLRPATSVTEEPQQGLTPSFQSDTRDSLHFPSVGLRNRTPWGQQISLFRRQYAGTRRLTPRAAPAAYQTRNQGSHATCKSYAYATRKREPKDKEDTFPQTDTQPHTGRGSRSDCDQASR